ncbi:uncharacterized protein QC764_0102090 [Podospora pseudoanserina]|uniref:DUF7605 domain-containing protein n=1 Tax=Podospora pseudoanserina TaxID=2609844 RepID=A0ABR0HK21_9PEZI|nr:hypothetical protein QC764_0102090 [Podospora pseudoanserina]
MMHAEVLECSGDLVSKQQQLAQVREDIKLLNNQSLRLKLTLLENPSNDMIVLELPQASPKRPARPAADEARKHFRKQQQDESPEASDLSDDAEPSFVEGEPRQEKISRDEASQRLQSLSEQMANSGMKELSIKNAENDLENKVKSMNEVIDLLKKQRRSASIRFRNDFSKPELQRQFGEGVLELDEEDAAYDDDYDPSKVQQDKYYKIGKKLPVFCVSSNSYHKLMGRLQEDESIHGFTTTDDTQVPMLKEHALNIVAQIECENYRQVLRDFARFLTGLHLRVLVAAKPYTLVEDIREVEKAILQDRLNELQQRFDSMIEEAFNNLDQAVHSNIFCKLPNARDTASKSATTAIERWFSRPRNGGLLYGTFRALVDPLMSFISPEWEKVFPDLVTKHLVTKHLVPLADGMIMELRAFSNLTAEREVLNELPVFFAVRHQMTLLEGILQDVPKLSKRLNDTQKSASRMIVSTITENMIRAYQACKEKKGTGCFGRMKELMTTHVETRRDPMFRAATKKVEKPLLEGLRDCRERVIGKGGGVVTKTGREFKRVLYVEHRIKVSETSKRALENLLATADRRFNEILHGSPLTPGTEVREMDRSAENDDGFDPAQDEHLRAPPADGDADSSDEHDDAKVEDQEMHDRPVKNEEHDEE